MNPSSSALANLRLRDLRLLEWIAQDGTLREVAARMNLTQPAVTRILHALEDALGTALVSRGRRGVQLTAAGEAALQRLRYALAEVDQACEMARQHEQPVLRLGVTPISCLQLLPRAISRLRQRLPQLRVVVVEGGTGALWEQLSSGALDALVARPPETGALPAGLRDEQVGSERLVVVARSDDPLLRRRRGAVSDWPARLAGATWALPPENFPAVQSLWRWLAQAGCERPVPAIESASFTASLQLVASTGMLSVVPEHAVATQGPGLGVRVLPVSWAPPPVKLVFAARDVHWQHPHVQALRLAFSGRKR